MSKTNLGLDVVKIRLVKERSPKEYKAIDNVDAAVELIKRELSTYDREVVCVVNVRSDMTPISMNIVSIGTLTASFCSPRDVFKAAVLANASGLITFHNHPTGRCHPSKDDYDITRKLEAAGKILDIELLDHIIVSSGPVPGYYSFKEHGEIGTNPFSSIAREDDDFER